jgi:2-iminobutanoate/2-iminopropanoate deaminase
MKQIISSDKAPQAIGPYSQAVVYGGLAYLSGQIPLDPETNTMVADDIIVQARRVLDNLKAVLEGCGSSLEKVLKTTIYIADMSEFPKVNDVYGEYFTANWPARATIQAAKLPRGARIEIDCIAIAG